MSLVPEQEPASEEPLNAIFGEVRKDADSLEVEVNRRLEADGISLPDADHNLTTTPATDEPQDEQIWEVARPALEQLHKPIEEPLFSYWSLPEDRRPARIPHFGHVLALVALALLGLLGSSLVVHSALHFRLFGIASAERAASDVHYTVGSMAILYLITFAGSLVAFPLIWHKGLFAGLHWNAGAAERHFKLLFGSACICFVLAMIDEVLLPGPTNAPIDRLFENRAAAWLLFGFGVTFAPFLKRQCSVDFCCRRCARLSTGQWRRRHCAAHRCWMRMGIHNGRWGDGVCVDCQQRAVCADACGTDGMVDWSVFAAGVREPDFKLGAAGDAVAGGQRIGACVLQFFIVCADGVGNSRL